MKCTTIHYLNSAISKSVKDLLEQHIPAFVETCSAVFCTNTGAGGNYVSCTDAWQYF